MLFLLFVCTVGGRRFIISRRYSKFQKKYNIQKNEAIFQDLYRDVDGFKISKQARQENDAIEYTYGEIEFQPFIALIALINPSKDTVFYDLGSGVGKAVMALAIVFDWKAYTGFELFKALSESSKEKITDLKKHAFLCERAFRIEFKQEDFMKANFSDATLVFVGMSVFFGERLKALNEHLLQLLPGTLVVSLSKAPLLGFEIIYQTEIKVSWGRVLAVISRRTCSKKE